MRFFQGFEDERRAVAGVLSDLQTRFVELTVEDRIPDEETEVMQEVSPEMLSYHLAFARDGASRENVATRSEIMYHKLEAIREH